MKERFLVDEPAYMVYDNIVDNIDETGYKIEPKSMLVCTCGDH